MSIKAIQAASESLRKFKSGGLPKKDHHGIEDDDLSWLQSPYVGRPFGRLRRLGDKSARVKKRIRDEWDLWFDIGTQEGDCEFLDIRKCR